jgi:cell division protein FtsA
MKAERLVMGLDVGSARTTAVVAEVTGELPRRPGVRVLGVGQARTTGLRRGAVADIEEAARSVRAAVDEAERMAGTRAEAVYVGIAGEHVRATSSHGIVAVAGDEITPSDVDRVNSQARMLPLPPDRELLHAIPQEYTVDGTSGIQQPAGMGAMRLETDVYLVTIGSQPAANLRKCVERAGTGCASWCSSRSRARSPCSPRTRRSSAWCSSTSARRPPTWRCSTRARSATSTPCRSAART